MKQTCLYDEDQNIESVDVQLDDDTTVNVPAGVIQQASEIAFEEDAFQVIGKIGNDDRWVIRGWEDPESDTLKYRIKIGSSGIE